MAWHECSKDKYWEAVSSGDNVVRAERDHAIWQTRYGLPVAKSSYGYVPLTTDEVFYVWASNEVKDDLHN